MILLLDNGHGSNTPGKCSPDRRLLEYKWAREMVNRIAAKTRAAGIQTEIITPETTDISLKERCRRVNALCAKYGTKNCVLISVHNNAAPGSGWSTASGFCSYVAPNASTNSKRFAAMLWEAANAAGLRGNRSVPSTKYWTGNFAIIRDTNCPAVLTENLFQNNQKEVDYLLSESGKETIANFHVKAIKEYMGI